MLSPAAAMRIILFDFISVMMVRDMEAKMIEHGVPLYALESGDPVKDFDFIGFTL